MAVIVPGILTADEDDYHRRLRLAEHVADLVQIDITDGKFTSGVTVGPGIVKKYPSSSLLEIQLMVIYPMNYIDDFAPLDFVSRIIFPFEIHGDVADNIYLVRRFAKQVGLSLNPQTPVAAALHFFDDIDLLLLMSGKPGFSGQKLGEEVYERIRQVKKFNPELPVEIDIGVNFDNAAKLARAGADFLVTSSALYEAPDFRLAYEKLAKIASLTESDSV